ncbi:MAG: hypothetical protein J4G13_03640 [Dehalococcoidia bacterium]|nr:hypothetical protein [Dehalococcoidia bacterium]
MPQTSPMEPFEEATVAIDDYRQQARAFLVKSRQYLDEDDLHQASEKGWGAAAWMAKAVAEAQGWEYARHAQFNVVLNNARRVTGDPRLLGMAGIANDLHGNFYTRKRFLDAEGIALSLDQMATLLEILEPLTETAQN